MKIRSFLNFCVLGVFCLSASTSAAAGGTRAAAVNLPTGKTTVSLGNGFDDSGYDSNGIYYFKFTVSRGSSCTVWTEGEREIDTFRIKEASMYTANKDWWGAPYFSVTHESDNLNYRGILRASGWNEESKATYTYFLCIEGYPGAVVTVYRTETEEEEDLTEYGTEEDPRKITMSPTLQTYPGTVKDDGKYRFVTELKEGEKYLFGPFSEQPSTKSMSISIVKGDVTLEAPAVTEFVDWTTDAGKGWCIKPQVSGDYRIVVTANADFTLQYKQVGGRTPAQHECEDLGKLTTEAKVSGEFKPGHRNKIGSEFRDAVIDERLFAVTLEKNGCYAFETVGADAALKMELYDASGNILAANDRTVVGGFDCALAFQATAAGAYYVGVCQKLADDDADPTTAGPCRLRAIKLETTAGEAEALRPSIGDADDDPVAKGAASAEHVLNVTNWKDSFRLAARKGVSYRLRAAVDASAVCGVKAVVYKLSATNAKTKFAEIPDLAVAYELASAANENYVVETEVAGDKGPSVKYVLHSLAFNPAGGGLVSFAVLLGGATSAEGAAWSLGEDGTAAKTYQDGDSLLLPSGKWTVKYKAVTGWSAPATETIELGEEPEVVLDRKYSDTCDDATDDAGKGDGSKTGKKVTNLNPVAVAAGKAAPTVSRSLWHGDEADWFKYTAKLKTFYYFSLADSSKLGDAVIEALDTDGETVLYRGRSLDFAVDAAKVFYIRVVHGTAEKADSQYVMSYSLKTLAARTVKSHDLSETFTKPGTDGASTVCAPGHRNSADRQFRDDIIDESLFKVTLEKGACYVFETEGADAALRMELYDANGKLLAANDCGKANGRDCLIGWQATAAGDHYVGVCQRLEDDDHDEVTAADCQFVVRKVTLADGVVEPLAPVIGGASDDPVEKGAAASAHELSPSDWTHTYSLAGRAGLIYRLRATTEASECAELWKLRADVYALTAAGKRPAKPTQVIEDLADVAEIRVTANANYEIDVSVDGCPGVTYPYVLHSLATGGEGVELGILKIEIGGATRAEGASLTFAEDGAKGVKYADGDSVILQARNWTAKFATVKDWTAPANEVMTVLPGEETVLSVKYSDTCDDATDDAGKGDGSKTGKKVTNLNPAAVTAGKAVPSVARSLWSADAADWFKFTTKVNTYYTFAFKGCDGGERPERLGDAVIDVFAEDGTSLIASGGESVTFLFRESKPVTYYVRISHMTDPGVDSQYELEYQCSQVGQVGFGKAEYSVKDNAASVSIPVNRSNGSVGRVRVKYETRANTAVPGENYYNQSGIIEWASEKTTATNLVIRLIPDLVAVWKEDLDFSVVLSVVPAEGEGEFIPLLGISKAVVTITPSVKKAPGTVRFCGYGIGNEPFAKIAQPTASVGYGENLTLWLERVDGADGTVGVVVTPTKGKAVDGVDFVADAATLVWQDGETGVKPFVLRTLASGEDYQVAKTMTVKLTADSRFYEKPAEAVKPGAAATITIGDGRITRTVEEYAASFAKADGVTVKATKADTWYFNESGLLHTVTPAKNGKCELTVTLVGPGKFAFTPYFEKAADDKSTFVCQLGKETLSFDNGKLESGAEVVRYFGTGNTTVKFTLTRDKNSVSDVRAFFGDSTDGQPFLWKKLPTPTLVSPLANEVAVAGACPDDPEAEQVTFRWSQSDDADIVYLFSIAEVKTNLDKPAAVLRNRKCEVAETSVEVACTDCHIGGQAVPGQLASGKTYYWRVDTTFREGGITNVNKSVWTIAPMTCNGTAKVALAGGMDADGNELSSVKPDGTFYPVRLVCGTEADLSLAGVNVLEDDKVTISIAKGSTLPKGLALKDGRISGIPTAAGTNVVVVQVSTLAADAAKTAKPTPGGTIALQFIVEPLRMAAGTFNGLLETEDERVTGKNDMMPMSLGSLSVTVAETGKITAKVVVNGTTVQFAGNGWTEAIPLLENGLPGVSVVLTNQTSLKVAGSTKTQNYPSTLKLTACRGPADDLQALDAPMVAEMCLCHLSADKTLVVKDVVWSGEALRDSKKIADYVSAFEAFVGYYTVSLPPLNPRKGLSGNGYLTLTVKKGGTVTLAGMLADGETKLSGSAFGYVFEGQGGEPELRVPVYYGKAGVGFGGWLSIGFGSDGVPLVRADRHLKWIVSDVNATYEGTEGFSLELEPTGGYYNTLYNLQRFYLEERFLVAGVDLAELPAEVFGDKVPAIVPGGYDESLTIEGNKITIAKDAVRNPANIALTFVQTTGIFNGSFQMFYQNGTKNTALGTYKHFGVLVMSRDENCQLLKAEDAVMSGFYTIPNLSLPKVVGAGARKFTANLPFLVVPQKIDYDWRE